MTLAILYFDVTDPDGFLETLPTTSHLFEGVEGFHGFAVRRGVEDPSRFLISAEWDTVDAHMSWQKAHADEFLGALGPHLAGPPDISHFE